MIKIIVVMSINLKEEAKPRGTLSYPPHRGYLLGHHLENSKASPLFIVIQAEETHGIEKGVPMGIYFFNEIWGFF